MCVRKEALSVAEMARAVGLCRARFYELLGTAFPFPVYDVATRRPFYPPEIQETCLEVRRRNRGIDGKAVMFRRQGRKVAQPKRPGRKAPDDSRCRELAAGLRSLGLAGVTAAQVQAVLKELGISGDEDGGAGLESRFPPHQAAGYIRGELRSEGKDAQNRTSWWSKRVDPAETQFRTFMGTRNRKADRRLK